MQEEGPLPPLDIPPLRLSRILRQEESPLADRIPMRRIVMWTLVWVGVIVGIVLYFKYARLLVPLLG